jgi:hypothetical protein
VKKRKERRDSSLKKTRRPHHKKDVFKIRCYTCEKLGHYAFQCPHGKGKRKHHAHAADMEEPSSQKKEKESKHSISALEDKGFRVAFMDGQVLLWPKSSSIDSATVIGV